MIKSAFVVLTLSLCFTSVLGQEQNLHSRIDGNETHLFYMHNELKIDATPNGETLRLKDVFMPYLGHLTQGERNLPNTWRFDNQMLNSFVLYDLFQKTNYAAGVDDDHLSLIGLKEYSNYLEDVFVKQGMLEYHPAEDIENEYFSNSRPNNSNSEALFIDQNFELEYNQGQGVCDEDNCSSSAVIGQYANNGIVQEHIQIPNGQERTFFISNFLKSWWATESETCENCYAMGIRTYNANHERLYNFDSDVFNFEESSQRFSYNSDLDLHEYEQDLDVSSKDYWQTSELVKLNLPNEVKYVDVFFYVPYLEDGNHLIGRNPVVAIDDVFFGSVESGNLIKDFGFDRLKKTESEWRRGYLEREKYNYSDRTAFFDAIFKSWLSLNDPSSHDIEMEPVYVYLAVPEIKFKGSFSNHYLAQTDEDGENVFYKEFSELVHQIGYCYDLWLASKGFSNEFECPVKIKGLYLVKESSRTPNKWDFAESYFSQVHRVVQEQFPHWEIIGAPYTKTCSSCEEVKSRYSDEFFPYINRINQQSNALAKKRASHAYQNVDPENFLYAYELSKSKNLGVHLDHTEREGNEQPYYRIIDGIDYGFKYGYALYPKSYNDEKGGFFNMAFSDNFQDKWAYDHLNLAIKTARSGKIVNAGFEYFSSFSENEFSLNWVYSGSKEAMQKENLHNLQTEWKETIDHKRGSFALLTSNFESIESEELIPIKENCDYSIRLEASLDCKQLIEVEHYRFNSNGSESKETESFWLEATEGWENLEFSFRTASHKKALKIIIHSAECDGDNLIDNLELVCENTERKDDSWSQEFPLRIGAEFPAYAQELLQVKNAEPLKVAYSSRFQNKDEEFSSEQRYKIAIRFFNKDAEVLRGDDIKLNRKYRLFADDSYDASQESIELVYNHDTKLFEAELVQEYYGCEYSKTTDGYLGCVFGMEDPNPEDPMDVWYTNQCVFNQFEIDQMDLPDGSLDYQLFFINSSGDASEFIVHRVWGNELEDPEKDPCDSQIVENSDVIVTEENREEYQAKWFEKSVSFRGNLTIKAKEFNFLESRISMDPNHHIIISEGSEVFAVRSEFTSCSEWGGFVLESDSKTARKSASLEMQNCEISNAYKFGIYSEDYSYNVPPEGSESGVMQLDQVNFNDNFCSIYIKGSIGREANLNSTITGCTFSGSKEKSVSSHVYLDNSNSIKFDECSFGNANITLEEWKDMGIGISGVDSQFELMNSEFSNLEFGVYISGLDPFNSSAEIELNSFSRCKISIAALNENNFKLHRNSISVGEEPLNPNLDLSMEMLEGISLQGSGFFYVQENELTGVKNQSENTIGIRVRDLMGSDAEIRKNKLEDFYVGNLANGVNVASMNNPTGLRYVCNEHVNNEIDVLVSEFSQWENSAAIGQNQGDLGREDTWEDAGNTFSDGGLNFIMGEQNNNEINYYSWTNGLDSEDVEFSESLNIFNVSTAENECLSEQFEQFRTPESASEALSMLSSISEHRGKLGRQFKQKYDGGNTVDLMMKIKRTSSAQSAEVVEELLSYSPFLSSSVLWELVRNDAFSRSQLFSVLSTITGVSNQKHMLAYAVSKPNGLTAEDVTQLKYMSRAQEGTFTLEEQYQLVRSAEAKWHAKLMNSNMFSREQKIDLLSDENCLNCGLMKAEAALLSGDFSLFERLMTGLEDQLVMASDIEKFEFQIWCEIVKSHQVNRDKNWQETAKNHREGLKDLAENYWSYSGKRAMALLNVLDGEFHFIPPVIGSFDLNSKSMEDDSFEKEVEVSVYPNPAVELLYIDLRELNSSETEIRVLNTIGSEVARESFSESGQVLEFQCGDWSPGFYTVQVIQNGEVIQYEKVEILRH